MTDNIDLPRVILDYITDLNFHYYEKLYYDGTIGACLFQEKIKDFEKSLMEKYNFTDDELKQSVKEYRERNALMQNDPIKWLTISDEHKEYLRKWLK